MASSISTGFETWLPPSEPDAEMVKLVQRVLENEVSRVRDRDRTNMKRARDSKK